LKNSWKRFIQKKKVTTTTTRSDVIDLPCKNKNVVSMNPIRMRDNAMSLDFGRRVSGY